MATSQKGFNPQPPILKVRQLDYGVSRQTEPAVDAVNRISEHPLLSSRTVEVSLAFAASAATSSTAFVPHGLGRPYRGWFVVGNTNDGLTVFETAPNSDKASKIQIKGRVDAAVVAGAATARTITLVVF